MRRALATFILTISLFIGAMAWSGFLLLNTALDPDRSERVATTLLDDPDVRDQISANIARALDANIPPEAGLPPTAASDAADVALDSPAVEGLVFDALVASHQALLGEGDAPSSIDGGAFGTAGRDALIAAHPELDAVLPAAPSLEIPLPTDRIPDLGPVRNALGVAVPIMALLAAVGAVTALVVTSNRPAVLRRAGIWAIGLSVLVIAFAFGVPVLAQRFLPDQSAVIAGVIAAMAETTRLPALAMAVAGLVGIALSFVWRPAAGALAAPERAAPPPLPRTGALRGERARRQAAEAPGRRFDVQPPNRPRPRTRGPGRGPGPGAGRPRTPPYGTPAAPASHPPRSRPLTPDTAAADATRVEPGQPEPQAAPSHPSRHGARWVADVGWVHDGDGPIPSDARFVPGVGYVLADG